MRKFLLSISIFSVISSVSYAQSFNTQETYRNLNGFNNFENQNQLESQNKKLRVDSIYESHLSNNFENTTRIFKPVINFPSKNKFIPKSNLNEGNNKEFQKEKLSTIENLFNNRIESENETINQFGYDFFSGYPNLYLSAPVDESYVLGPGDELFLYVIGIPPGIDLGKVVKLVVDREGKIYIPRIGVFYVWGKTLKETEKIISSSVGANIKLTVGRLRTFPVYVSGDVKRPGAVVVTALNTVIDAIMMAGGIKKDGTLRDIIITRRTPKGLKRIHIDFYKLLLEGEPVDMRLKDGDVIFVHSIGKVAGIVGKVKRPAIYELKRNETVSDLIKMAGGLLPSSYKYKVILQRFENNHLLKVYEGSLDDKRFMNKKLKDGDLVFIKQIVDIPENAVSVEGYTTYPGLYEYKPGEKLSKILKPDMFFPDSNMRFGLIERRYPLGSLPKYLTFSPEDVLKGKEDLELKPRDRIILYKFGEKEIIDFNKVKDAFLVEGEIKYPGIYAYKRGMKLSDILNRDMLTLNTNLYYAEVERRDLKTLEITGIEKFAPIDVLEGKKDLTIHRLDVIKFYPKYVYPPVRVSGLVKESYYLPYHKGLKLSEALSSAKFSEDIKKLKVEIFREVPNVKSARTVEKAENIKAKAESGSEILRKNVGSVFLYDLLVKKDSKVDIPLNPGDRLVIQEVKPEEMVEKVTVLGYVRRPGVYRIDEKTTLYDVLKAAGGFRENAYPQGIVVLRESVREMQKERLSKAISLMRQELEKEEAGVMQSDLTQEELRARQSAFEAKRRLLSEMEKAQVTGRISGIVVPYNLEKLKNSSYNILLEDGDKIYIPKKPSSILIFGEVYNPSALVYQKNMTVRDYIAMSGGFTKDADKKNVFVIKADGSVVSSENLGGRTFDWNSSENRIELGSNSVLDYKLNPGDAIIVPTKIHVPVMWRPLIKDVMQIIYQGAITVYTITKL
jgi:polysaccharide export outer membrane protein